MQVFFFNRLFCFWGRGWSGTWKMRLKSLHPALAADIGGVPGSAQIPPRCPGLGLQELPVRQWLPGALPFPTLFSSFWGKAMVA